MKDRGYSTEKFYHLRTLLKIKSKLEIWKNVGRSTVDEPPSASEHRPRKNIVDVISGCSAAGGTCNRKKAHLRQIHSVSAPSSKKPRTISQVYVDDMIVKSKNEFDHLLISENAFIT